MDPKPVLVSCGVAAIAVCLATRTATPVKPPPSWEATMRAPVEPGVGVGDLVLGETTLRACMELHGKGSFSVIGGDQLSIGLSYLSGQVRLQFDIPPTEDGGTIPWSSLRDAVRDPMNFVASHPQVGEAPLAWIQLRAGSTAESTYYRGLCEECRLHDPSASLQRSKVFDASRLVGLKSGAERKVAAPGLAVLVTQPRASNERSWLKRISIFPIE